MNRFCAKVAELLGHPDPFLIARAEAEPLSDAQLNELDRVAEVALPDDFREWLRDYNGYRFSGQRDQKNEETRACARNGDLFCNWYYNGWTHPDFASYKDLCSGLAPHYPDWAPANLRTIGTDGNTAVLLAVAGANCGSVFFWDPTENDGTYACVTLLAHSFEQFFLSMQLDDVAGLSFHDDRKNWPAPQHFAPVPHRSNRFAAQMADSRYAYVPLGEAPQSASETDLQRVELAIGAQLPADYREFLRDYGACSLKEMVFYSALRDDRYDIAMQWSRTQTDRREIAEPKVLPLCEQVGATTLGKPMGWLILEGEKRGSLRIHTSNGLTEFSSFAEFVES